MTASELTSDQTPRWPNLPSATHRLVVLPFTSLLTRGAGTAASRPWTAVSARVGRWPSQRRSTSRRSFAVSGELSSLPGARGWAMNDFKGRHFEGEVVLWRCGGIAGIAQRVTRYAGALPPVVSRLVSWNPHGNSPVCSVDELPGMTKQPYDNSCLAPGTPSPILTEARERARTRMVFAGSTRAETVSPLSRRAL